MSFLSEREISIRGLCLSANPPVIESRGDRRERVAEGGGRRRQKAGEEETSRVCHSLDILPFLELDEGERCREVGGSRRRSRRRWWFAVWKRKVRKLETKWRWKQKTNRGHGGGAERGHRGSSLKHGLLSKNDKIWR